MTIYDFPNIYFRHLENALVEGSFTRIQETPDVQALDIEETLYSVVPDKFEYMYILGKETVIARDPEGQLYVSQFGFEDFWYEVVLSIAESTDFAPDYRDTVAVTDRKDGSQVLTRIHTESDDLGFSLPATMLIKLFIAALNQPNIFEDTLFVIRDFHLAPTELHEIIKKCPPEQVIISLAVFDGDPL